MYQDARGREGDASSREDLVKQEEGRNSISDQFIAPRLWLSHPLLLTKRLRHYSGSFLGHKRKQ